MLLLLAGALLVGISLALTFLSGEELGEFPLPETVAQGQEERVEVELDPSMSPLAVFFDYEVEAEAGLRTLVEAQARVLDPGGEVVVSKALDITQTRKQRRSLTTRVFGGDRSGSKTFETFEVEQQGRFAFVFVPGSGAERLEAASWRIRRNVTRPPTWLLLAGIALLLLGALAQRVLR
jgi:hypothetical protein